MTETEHDKMLIIKILYERMNWSFRRIGRLFNQHKNTVTSLYDKALEYNVALEAPKSSIGGEVSVMYVGGTNEVEYADADVHHNVTGGGRKIETRPT